LALLREAKEGPVRPDHYLLRMHPARDALPNKDVFARRMGKVAGLVGLKLPGQRSHIYRRTHSSWANMKGMQPHEIKLFLGHDDVFGGATDEYVRFIRQMTRPEHRTYIDLPSPEEIDEFLATGWVPPFAQKQRGGGAPQPV
jgi:integrase